MFGTEGTLALIPLIDLFNHHQPEIYKRDYVPFYLKPRENFMGVAVEKKFKKGEEVIYTYSQNLEAAYLLYEQGMVFPNNPHAVVTLKHPQLPISRFNQL